MGIVMGSASDLPAMEAAAAVLAALEVGHEVRVISAHRTPQAAADYARQARERGIGVIIAGAGGAAHLAGAIAANTSIPVIGVPLLLASGALGGFDALCSTVMMPAGVPVATVGIGGAENAGLLAAQILALSDSELMARLEKRRQSMAERVADADARVSAKFGAAGSEGKGSQSR